MELTAAIIAVFYLFSIFGWQVPAERPPAAILLLDPKCDAKMVAAFDKGMRMSMSQIDKYVGKFEVKCYPGVKSIAFIDRVSLPILRLQDPSKIYVFVFTEKMASEFNRYLFFKVGNTMANPYMKQAMWQGKDVVKGWGDIDRGVGFANQEIPYYAKHELAHLWQCGTWHDANSEATGKMVKHPNAEKYAWCKK